MKNFKDWLTDATLLAVASVGGYFLVFIFETGFAVHFGYPTYVISPTPGNMAFAFLLLVTVGSCFPLSVVLLLHKGDLRERLQGSFVLVYGLLVVLMLVMLPHGALSYVTAAVGVLFMIVFFRIEQWRKERKAFLGPENEWTFHVRLYTLILAVFLFMALVVITLFAGVSTARYQSKFFFLASKPGFAIVRMYGELVVSVKVDRNTGQLTGEYFIGKFGSDELKLELKRERVLQPRPLLPFALDDL